MTETFDPTKRFHLQHYSSRGEKVIESFSTMAERMQAAMMVRDYTTAFVGDGVGGDIEWRGM